MSPVSSGCREQSECGMARPVLEDGRLADVSNVIWCTGFRHDFGWIDLPVLGDDGQPVHERGVVRAEPGLYFVGLLFSTR